MADSDKFSSFGYSATLLSEADETGAAVYWGGGLSRFVAWGTWDGATVRLQSSPDDGSTWIDEDGVSATADGGFRTLDLEAGLYRAAVSDAGASTAVSANLKRTG